MFLYGILITPYPASLTAYHIFLMGRGETTREYLNLHKFLKIDRHRPFTQGNFFKNLIVILMRPRPPSNLHFKTRYVVGDQRFGLSKSKEIDVAKQHESGVEMQNFNRTVPSFSGQIRPSVVSIPNAC